MLNYVVLATFTDQGLKAIKDTTKRADAAKEIAGKFGVKMNEIYWTQGQYDLVTLCEGKDEAAMAAFGLALSSQGNIKFQTLRAFTRDEMNGILKQGAVAAALSGAPPRASLPSAAGRGRGCPRFPAARGSPTGAPRASRLPPRRCPAAGRCGACGAA